MTIESYVAVASLLVSFVAVASSFRKNRAEVYNLDAKTFSDYQKTLKESHDNYQAVLNELDEMRKKFNNQDIHIRALMGQLRSARIVPITLEEALKIKNGG